MVGALLRDERPATVAAARDAIDRTDAALAVILERRAALAGVVQRLKPVGGFAGRDPERERRIVAAMARRAPRLGERRLAPIMKAVIESGLHLAEELRGSPGDNGGEPAPGPETPAAARRHHD
ncbi:chorismate mutase [Sphaerisporangium siamense]|uniref:chorismate mutase n=1 Tax=Sphaerisporangium siamense TaxID=795645 RepID=UPI001EF1BBAF|nr:chorismate mutase [Sphaerisporangium siamense]